MIMNGNYFVILKDMEFILYIKKSHRIENNNMWKVEKKWWNNFIMLEHLICQSWVVVPNMPFSGAIKGCILPMLFGCI